jgi:hypothetical protein
MSIRAKMKEIIPEYCYQTASAVVPNESAENAFPPVMNIERAFAAGAGQD